MNQEPKSCQPTFYRPVKNPKEICGHLTEGIREALPEILSTKTSKKGLRAIIKQRQECPSLPRSIFPRPESIESAQRVLRFRVTGLHTIVKAAEQLICLTFEDPKGILSEEKREIADLLQDCYNKKDRHGYWQVISSGAEPYIPIAVAGIGLPENSLNEYAAERLEGKDLHVVLGGLAVSPDVRARTKNKEDHTRRRRSPGVTSKTHKPNSASTEQTPSGITVVRLSPDRQPIPQGFLQTLIPS